MPNQYVNLTGLDHPLDLAKPDLGRPGGAALLEHLLADRRLPASVRGVTCAEICKELGFTEPMYLYRRMGRVVASHTRSDAEDRHHGGGESDHHKAYKERAVHAAEEGGHTGTKESPSPDGSIRNDVLIRGANGLLLGYECQLSKVDADNISARDAAASRAGIVNLWQTDNTDLARDTVFPWLRTPRLPAQEIAKWNTPLPFRGGIRHIEMLRCDERFPGPCPDRTTGKCGNWHPTTRLTERPFDDFIRDAASGLYVRATVKVKRLAFEFWTPAADHRTYLDAMASHKPVKVVRPRPAKRPMNDGTPTCRQRTGTRGRTPAPLNYIPAPRSSPPSREPLPLYRGLCGSGVTPCGAPARFYACGWRCDSHRP